MKLKSRLSTFLNDSTKNYPLVYIIAAALYPDMHVQPIALPLIVKAEMMHRLPKIW